MFATDYSVAADARPVNGSLSFYGNSEPIATVSKRVVTLLETVVRVNILEFYSQGFLKEFLLEKLQDATRMGQPFDELLKWGKKLPLTQQLVDWRDRLYDLEIEEVGHHGDEGAFAIILAKDAKEVQIDLSVYAWNGTTEFELEASYGLGYNPRLRPFSIHQRQYTARVTWNSGFPEWLTPLWETAEDGMRCEVVMEDS